MADDVARTEQDELDRSLSDVLQSVRLETGFISRAARNEMSRAVNPHCLSSRCCG